MPILGGVDTDGRSAEDVDAGLLAAAWRGCWESGLPSRDDAERVLFPVDGQNGFETQFVEVKLVALVVVGADGFGVVVDDDRAGSPAFAASCTVLTQHQSNSTELPMR